MSYQTTHQLQALPHLNLESTSHHPSLFLPTSDDTKQEEQTPAADVSAVEETAGAADDSMTAAADTTADMTVDSVRVHLE